MKKLIILTIFLSSMCAFAYADTPTSEAFPLKIKGTRVFTFYAKNIEGTKEGYLPGVNREESLRINIAGNIKDAEIDANFFSSSVLGASDVSSREESVSILLRRGSLEAFLGDFTPHVLGTEYGQINKVLSGLSIRGDYDNFGFHAIASTPKGQSRLIKLYGNETQGPYYLTPAPVVIDSEKVYVDNVLQKRGNDYEIDNQSGTITFKNKVIHNIQVINIYYDSSGNIYKHTTYGLRAYYKPLESLAVGATYIDDSDSLSGAKTLYTSGSLEPQSHYLAEVDSELYFGKIFSAKGEFAYSHKRPKMLSDYLQVDSGKAYTASISSSFLGLSLQGDIKRIDPKFEKIGEALPKNNLSEQSIKGSYSPFDFLLAEGGYSKSSYSQNSIFYQLSDKNGRLKLSPKFLPSADYVFDELWESNDPVTALQFNRLTTKNSLELKQDIGFLKGSVKASRENRLIRSPSFEATTYNIASAGLSLAPLDNFSASTNIELKETVLPSGLKPLTKTGILNLSASPRKEYMLSGSLNYIDDAQYGISQTSNIAFKAEPLSQIKTSGKYMVNSLNETYGLTSEGIKKEEVSLNLELRPIDMVRLRYNYKPNFTMLNRTQGITYSNILQQFESSFFILRDTMLGFSYQSGNNFQIDKADYPNYKRKLSSQDSYTKIYSIKSAPLRFLSCEFNYILNDGTAFSLASVETLGYSKQNSRDREFNAAIKTSMAEKFAFDGSFSHKTAQLGSEESFDDMGNALIQATTLKLIFNLSDSMTLTPSYTYSQTTDYLAKQDIYALGPGFSFILKFFNRLRFDGTLTYLKSNTGSSAENTKVNLQGRYDLSDYVHIIARINSELNRNPDYRISEFQGNVEINL